MPSVPTPLGIKNVMDAVVSVTVNRYSFETMNLMRSRVKSWETEVRSTRCKVALAIPDCDKFDVDLVELSFERIKDPVEREYLDRVPTAFTLSPEQIIRLRRAAHLLVDESPDLRTFSRRIRKVCDERAASRRALTPISVISRMQ